MIIDTHTHFTKLPNTKFAENLDKNLDYIKSEMAEAGVGLSLVIAWLGENPDRPTTNDLIHMTADHDNLKVIGSIDILNYTHEDMTELEGYLMEKKVLGLKLYTGYQHFYPNDPRCLPVYALCMKYNVPVIFHSGDTLAGVVPNPKIKFSHPLHIDDIAADYPGLKIVIAHMGNPWLIDCAEVIYKNPNVYADISGLVVGSDLDTPYGAMMRDKIHDLINYVGGDNHKLLYATDWPLAPMDVYVKFAKSLNLNANQQDQLFFKNAQKVFNI